MPLQPPSSSAIPTARPPPQPAAGGLSRTRSLRRPQAGPSASAAAAAEATGRGETDASSASSATVRGLSPSRLPVKPPSKNGSGSGSGAAGVGGGMKTTAKARPPSATSGTVPRLRQPDTGAASAGAAPVVATKKTTSTTVPPSSSRTHLLSSAATGPVLRRPTSAGGSRQPSTATVAATPTTSSGTIAGATRTRPVGTMGGHARTKSTSVTTTIGLASVPALRPPSAQSSSAGSSSSAATSRPPTRGATGPPSTSRPTATTTAKGPPTAMMHRRQPSASAAAPTSSAPGATSNHRPAFSTLQQHFSPTKNLAPKPRIAAILAPPASPSKKPANVALSAETGRLQTALLQLHLLHRDAAAHTAAWHASARHALAGERFSALAAEHATLMQAAGARAEAANAAALKAWGSPPSSSSFDRLALEEKVQALDSVLAGLWALVAAGGDMTASATTTTTTTAARTTTSSSTSRYVHVVRRFERWLQQTAALAEARQRITTLDELMDEDSDSDGDEDNAGGNGDHGDRLARRLDLLAGDRAPLLDAAWHDECGHLARRLQGWQQQLAHMSAGVDVGAGVGADGGVDRHGDAPSLHRILAACRSLTDGMLEELQLMQQLERDAAAQEQAWIRRMNASAGIVGGADGGSVDDTVRNERAALQTARAGAIWRAM